MLKAGAKSIAVTLAVRHDGKPVCRQSRSRSLERAVQRSCTTRVSGSRGGVTITVVATVHDHSVARFCHCSSRRGDGLAALAKSVSPSGFERQRDDPRAGKTVAR